MRLNEKDRDALKQFAQQWVTSPETEAATKAAYNAAAKAVRAVVDERFPPRDMKVLARYNVAFKDRCINNGHWMTEFTFTFNDDDDRAPLLPKNRCERRQFDWSPEVRALLEVHHRAKDLHRDAINKKLAHYRSLINGARTFEDITSVWPAAAVLQRQAGPKKKPVFLPVSVEAINFIKSDNAGATP